MDHPILLLHGTGLDASMWDGLTDALIAAGTEPDSIHTVDLLGHGMTPRPNRPLHIDDYVRQIRKYVHREEVDRVQLVGHSLGGLVALAFCAAHSDLVSKAAVIGVPYGQSDAQRNEWLDLIMAASAVNDDDADPDDSDTVAQAIPLLLDRWLAPADAAGRAHVAALLAELAPTTFGLVFRISMTSEPAITDLGPQVTTPVNVLAGSADVEVELAGIEALAELLPDATASTITDHYHMSIVSDPAPYLDHLL